MHIAVEPVNGDTIHAVIMIAANEYLLRMQKVAEPGQKIQCFRLTAVQVNRTKRVMKSVSKAPIGQIG